jgi:hypothetical protein
MNVSRLILMKTAVLFLLLALSVAAQTAGGTLDTKTEKRVTDDTSAPQDVTYCDLSRDSGFYNHKLVRLTAFVTHGFEDFHLADPSCHTQDFRVWVMYGGNVQSNTMYCCPGEAAGKTRPQPLTIEGIEIQIVQDVNFKEFADLLAKDEDTTVRVTVVGRFFSGEKAAVDGGARWRGFGHMGCCSLFVIEHVESFEPHIRSDLDYTSEAGWYEKEGCKYSSLHYQRHVSIPYPDGEVEQAIAEQRKADTGEAAWAFSDPQRVAVESLKVYYPDQVPVLRTVKQSAARYVFRWKNGKNQVVVVVIRPYWLSFYANSRSVVWVTTTIKEAGCG